MAKSKPATVPPAKKHRDAESGKYVTEEYAKKHKKTTVAETDKPKKK